MRAADSFYKTQVWKDCREAYAKSAGGLCERCLAKGLYEPGVIVHHIQPLTSDNWTDPKISLNFDNLQLVCRNCHAEIHAKKIKRFSVDAFGRVAPR